MMFLRSVADRRLNQILSPQNKDPLYEDKYPSDLWPPFGFAICGSDIASVLFQTIGRRVIKLMLWSRSCSPDMR